MLRSRAFWVAVATMLVAGCAGLATDGETDRSGGALATAGDISVVGGNLSITGIGPANPIIYDNDWFLDIGDDEYLWGLMNLGQANVRGQIATKDMWDAGRLYTIAQAMADCNASRNKALNSGMSPPVCTQGSNIVLTTARNVEVTAGSNLIKAEARAASPATPLVIAVGGPPTTVANAILDSKRDGGVDISNRIVVMAVEVTNYNGNDAEGWNVIKQYAKLVVATHVGDMTNYNLYYGPWTQVKNFPSNQSTDYLKSWTGDNLWRGGPADGMPFMWLWNNAIFSNAEKRSGAGDGTVTTNTTYDTIYVRPYIRGAELAKEYNRVMMNPNAFIPGGGSPVAPLVTTQPSNTTAVAGTTATFAGACSGTAPSYQWTKNGTDLAGATAASYTTPAVATTDNGTSFAFRCMNAVGSAGSNAATLTVTEPPPPGSVGTGLEGKYYSGTAFGTLALTRTDATVNFDWGNGSPAIGVPVDNFSVRWTGTVKPESSGTYTFFTTSDDGQRLWVNGILLVDDWTVHGALEKSGSIALTAGTAYDIKFEYYEAGGGAVAQLRWQGPNVGKQVIPVERLYPPVILPPVAPTVTTQPGAASVVDGASFTMAGACDGRPAPTYQWKRNGAAINGATSATYTMVATLAMNGDVFVLGCSNTAGTVASAGVTLTVAAAAPVVTTQPANASVVEGKPATFSGVCGGTSPAYQWRKNGVAITGATSASYTTPATVAADNGAKFGFTCTNTLSSATSNDATLTVTKAATTGTGLRGRYYSGTAFNTLVLTRTDATVNFNWGTGSPGTGMPADNFSVRWEGTVKAAYSGTYTFYVNSDDGQRLWVNGQQLVNDWVAHGATEKSGTITLTAGSTYTIKYEYYEAGGGAVAQLRWSHASVPKQIVPMTSLFPATTP